MKLFQFLLISIGLLFVTALDAQKKAEPSADEIAQAKQLKKTYEDAEIVALNSLEKFVFGYDETTKMVTVNEKTKDRIMCIVPDHKTSFVKFYDAESEIKSIQVFYKTAKQKAVYPTDEYYNDSDYFYSDARLKYFNLHFPAQGYQYQVNFSKDYKDVKYLTRAFFSTYYPIEKKEIQFEIPRWLKVELVEMNFAGLEITKTVEYDKAKDADIHTYTTHSLKADIKEKNSPGPSHLHPHILILAKSYEKNGRSFTLFDSTKDLYGWYRSLVEKVDNDDSVLKEKVEELTAGATDDLEKVKSIYYWVQDNIRYIAFEDGIAGFKPDNCQNVFKNKYGDCKGMANLTKRMLNLANFDARLTWIGTDRIAYDYSTPSLAVDNHMICTVIIDGKKYFLDPTEKYNPFNEYAQRIQGKQALIEDGENFILETVPVMSKVDNQEMIRRRFKIEKESLVGTGEHIFNGESKSSLLYSINNLQNDNKDDAIKNYITERDKNQKVGNITTSDLNNRDQVFKINYDLVLENAVSSFGDQIYLDMDYYKEYGRFKFDGERKVDYKLGYKILAKVETELEMPEGYVVAEMPKGMSEKHEDFSFQINYLQKGNKIIYQKEISIDKAIIRQKDFKLWDSCIDKLNEVYQQQIVLEKKSQ